jgi:hypothetical protein
MLFMSRDKRTSSSQAQHGAAQLQHDHGTDAARNSTSMTPYFESETHNLLAIGTGKSTSISRIISSCLATPTRHRDIGKVRAMKIDISLQ